MLGVTGGLQIHDSVASNSEISHGERVRTLIHLIQGFEKDSSNYTIRIILFQSPNPFEIMVLTKCVYYKSTARLRRIRKSDAAWGCFGLGNPKRRDVLAWIYYYFYIMNSNEKGKLGEEFVNELSFNSFFRYWCFPNPKDENGDKKEICDLLIVFGQYLVIFSVKNYQFKEQYSKYFRQTIEKSERQIWGAENKLFGEKTVYIKHPDRVIEKFEGNKILKVFRIIVNLGEGVKFYPFNRTTKDEKFINVFDKKAFEQIVSELDTLPDFLEYLDKREKFFFDKRVVILPGEENDFPLETSVQYFEISEKLAKDENTKRTVVLSGTESDLLANYIENGKLFPELLQKEEYTHAYLTLDGAWKEFISKSQVAAKKKDDKISYFVDELVKREVLINSNLESEVIARELLMFNRFERRIISKSFFDFYEKNKLNSGYKFARRYADFNGTGIVFIFYTLEMPQYMVDCLVELAVHSFQIFSNYKSKKLVAICTTRDLQQIKLACFENELPFTTEVENEIKDAVAKLGWFTNHRINEFTEKEYPPSQ